MPLLSSDDLHAIVLTLKLAFVSATLLVVLMTPVVWWLTRRVSVARRALGAIFNLPLVLPPTVLGFYLLIFMGPSGLLGRTLMALGWPPLTFTFAGLVVGSLLYSLPFALTPLQRSFQRIGRRPLEVAATLGVSPTETFFRVVLPLAKPGLISAFMLCFAHTLGEFGVVLMIGGAIPGQTQVMSTLIYREVEGNALDHAHTLSVLMVGVSFLLLYLISIWDKPSEDAL